MLYAHKKHCSFPMLSEVYVGCMPRLYAYNTRLKTHFSLDSYHPKVAVPKNCI